MALTNVRPPPQNGVKPVKLYLDIPSLSRHSFLDESILYAGNLGRMPEPFDKRFLLEIFHALGETFIL